MKYTKAKEKQVLAIIKKHRLVSDRENELLKKGFHVSEVAMGSGGTGQVKNLKSEVRIQIGYGHGKHNYAKVVKLEK